MPRIAKSLPGKKNVYNENVDSHLSTFILLYFEKWSHKVDQDNLEFTL